MAVGREKGKPPMAKREKGKPRPVYFYPELTRHTHRAHTRTTQNDFPVELSPPPPMLQISLILELDKDAQAWGSFPKTLPTKRQSQIQISIGLIKEDNLLNSQMKILEGKKNIYTIRNLKQKVETN